MLQINFFSMSEMSPVCENHRYDKFVTGIYDFLVSDAAPRLDDESDSKGIGRFHAVAERKKRI